MRSSPHWSRSFPWQNTVPGSFSAQAGTSGWQEPALPPGIVSQLSWPEQLPFGCHTPPLQMSWPFCACPAHAYAPFGVQRTPSFPVAVPSPIIEPSLASAEPSGTDGAQTNPRDHSHQR